jgi:sulfane dehydrogenase subunit SoxC
MAVKTIVGRLLRAPENFISDGLIDDIRENGLNADRRDFIRKSFAAASAALMSGHAVSAADHPGGDGDPAI